MNVPIFRIWPVCGIILMMAGDRASAQDKQAEMAPGNVAFVRIVNAIGLKTPTKVSFRTSAEPKWSEMAAGEVSGMRALRLGDYRLRVSNDGCEKPEVEDTISLQEGGIHAVIVLYTEAIRRDDQRIHRLQYSKLERTDSAGQPRLSIVSLVDIDGLPIQVGSQRIALLPRRAQHFNMKLDQSIAIRHEETPVMDPIEITEAVPYLVFLFRNEATGKVEGALAREFNVVLELPRPVLGKQEP